MSEAYDRMWWDNAAKGDYVKAITNQSDPLVYDQWGLFNAGTLEELLPDAANLTLLEWGCGAGRVTQFLDEMFKRVIAVDFSGGMLGILAGLKLKNTESHQITGNVLPLADRSVDAAYSHAVLMHQPKATVPAIVAECRRVLRPGGKFVFSLPVYETGVDRLPAYPGSVAVWTPAEVTALFAGWTVVTLQTNPGPAPATAADPRGKNHYSYHVMQTPIA